MVRPLYSASILHKLASQYWSSLFQHIPNPVETSVVKQANRAIRRRGTQLNSDLPFSRLEKRPPVAKAAINAVVEGP